MVTRRQGVDAVRYFATTAEVAALLVIFVGCARPQPTPEAVPTGASIVVDATDSLAHLYRGDGQKWAQPLRMIISDSVAMDSLRHRMGINRDPRVNFARNQVVIAILGGETIGPVISIDTVADLGHERIIIVRRTYPPRRCLEGQIVVAPADVVIIPRDTVRAVRFVERLTTLPRCL